MKYHDIQLIFSHIGGIMDILRIGETTHGEDFRVLRKSGYPFYLLLLIETPSQIEAEHGWCELPAHTAVLFAPNQRHSYRAHRQAYTDCWMHIQSDSPLLFDGFPFGRPIPLHSAQRFYSLFRILRNEYFAEGRMRESIVHALCSALLSMLVSEVEFPGPLFYPFLQLREEIFHSPARAYRAEDAVRSLGLSCGHFHLLYRTYFHTTFLSDVIRARIQAAQELLLSTSDTVGQIAECCGYANPEHFIRQFKQSTGMTPHRYRKFYGDSPMDPEEEDNSTDNRKKEEKEIAAHIHLS